jgi:hypothetical protein
VGLLRPAYVVGFGLTAAAWLLNLRRASRVEGPGTRRGLAGLLAFDGAWALAHVVRFLAPAGRTQAVAYYGYYINIIRNHYSHEVDSSGNHTASTCPAAYEIYETDGVTFGNDNDPGTC